MVAIATVETTATRKPPMIAGTASGNSTCRRTCPLGQPHAAGCFEHLVRGTLQPRDEVREQDHECVRHERDLDRRPG